MMSIIGINILVSYLGAPLRLQIDRTDISGLSLRELVYEFRHQTLVLFKCALLQPKVASLHSLLAAAETMADIPRCFFLVRGVKGFA